MIDGTEEETALGLPQHWLEIPC